MVKSPVVVLPSLPRFMAFGDKAQAMLTVRNDTGRDGEFTVAVNASGPVAVAGSPRTTRIAKAGTAQVPFELTAAAAEGLATVSLAVSGNGETTADTLTLPVRAPLPPRTSVRSGAMEAAALTIPELASGEFLPGSAKRDVAVGPYPLIRFAGNLKSLLGYPYGCLEQTTSKAFPLLYFADEGTLYNPRLKRRYEVRDDIPIMLIDEATTVDDAEHDRLIAKAEADGIAPTFEA